ncbi:MAG: hypothetical protein GY761_03105 [Hyphomicrobiales bacterium]|nr:hypothetical protein [Hyphomicrobiales bacterium]
MQPSSLPEKGLAGIGQATLAKICRAYAPKVIPIVIKEIGFSEAQFVSVRVLSGSSIISKYLLQVYTIENGTCGKELN